MLARACGAVLLTTIAAIAANAGATPSSKSKEDDPDRVICRAATPVLGSRVAMRRTCRTRAEWQAYEQDRQQMRRDIQNAGKDVAGKQ